MANSADRPGIWVLLRTLVWNGATQLAVPAGFVTDLASIPRGLRGILNQNGNSRRPAVLHDFLYRTKPMTRAASDALFRAALMAEGMSAALAAVYWLGVRSGGWFAWRSAEERGRRARRNRLK